jgi:hypothetical protein
VDAIDRLAGQVSDRPGLRVRQGAVVSVSSYGVTVTIGGSTDQVAGVKYLGSYAPRVGAHVWLITDGSDVFAIGHLAPRGVPALRVSGAAAAVVTATETALAFDAEVGTDPWAMWVVGAATRITVPLDGWYTFTAYVSFAANATGIRGVKIRQGGSTALAFDRVPAAGAGTTELTTVTGPVSLSATNFVEVTVEQTSGGNLNVTPVMGVHYIGPAE